jgi:ribosomal protein S18 acetylase RimI-like enzyme
MTATDTIIVREAAVADYAALLPVLAEVDALHRSALPHIVRAPEEPSPREEYVRGLIESPDSALLLAAGPTGIVGALVMRVAASPDSPLFVPRRVAVVDVLAVLEEARGCGIGRRLMAAAEAWARERGLDAVELTVWEFNAGARAFYDALGYATVMRRIAKRLANEDGALEPRSPGS